MPAPCREQRGNSLLLRLEGGAHPGAGQPGQTGRVAASLAAPHSV